MGTEIEVVERVEAAIETSLDLSHNLKIDLRNDGEFAKAARAALEASHHAELVEALRAARCALHGVLLDKADAALAKLPNTGRV